MWAIGFSSKTRRESQDHTDHEGVKEKGIVVKQIRRNGVLALAVFIGLVLVYQSWEQRTGSDGIKGVIASQLQKLHIVTQMLADLLASVEAERNAVVAGSDAESEQYAAQAEALTEKVEQRRKELLSVIEKEPAGIEAKLLGEFSTAWEEFLTVDRELLGQAVLNTNLNFPIGGQPSGSFNGQCGSFSQGESFLQQRIKCFCADGTGGRTWRRFFPFERPGLAAASKGASPQRSNPT